MTDPIAPLPASARMGDAAWPGVIAQLGPDWRLCVSSDGKRYVLQQLAQTDAGPLWVAAGGKSPATLGRIVAKYAAQVEGLAALCESLPDDPAQAAPAFVGAVYLREVVHALRDVRRSTYGRVVAQDGQIRLAVDPDGQFYLIQWVPQADLDLSYPVWQVLHSAETLSDVRAFMLGTVFQPEGSGRRNRRRGDDLSPRVEAFLSGLPERADGAVWPVLYASASASAQR